jgi:hypothetical protein
VSRQRFRRRPFLLVHLQFIQQRVPDTRQPRILVADLAKSGWGTIAQNASLVEANP